MIVTSGGEAADVIPGRATAAYDCRATTAEELAALKARIRACFEAGALATDPGQRRRLLADVAARPRRSPGAAR
ncbi:peptidase dimerization domain-containing protein [Streptomyces sp. NPDC051921]|uniref:peptidase dimerization domain-containing protein n=1 Tax=Streptomyces sp. NPDC051921 TaxID=3155806 RepID=UPI003425EC81